MQRVFRAVVTTVVPEAAQFDAAGWTDFERIVERALADRPASLRRGLKLFLRLIDWIAVARYARRFSALDAARRSRDRLSRRPAGLGRAPVSETAERRYDVVIIGSGAGGGTVAQELAPLVRNGQSILVLEKGPRFADHEFTGVELEMRSEEH